MKKIISFLFSPLLFLGIVSPAFATSVCPPKPFDVLCKSSSLDLGSVVGAFINFIFVLSVVVALLYLIWGGFKWLTSGGDKTAVGAAREHIIAAIIGLIVIFLSYLILNIVIGFFIPGFSISNFKVPTINGTSSTGSSIATCSPACKTGFVCNGTVCIRDGR